MSPKTRTIWKILHMFVVLSLSYTATLGQNTIDSSTSPVETGTRNQTRSLPHVRESYQNWTIADTFIPEGNQNDVGPPGQHRPEPAVIGKDF